MQHELRLVIEVNHYSGNLPVKIRKEKCCVNYRKERRQDVRMQDGWLNLEKSKNKNKTKQTEKKETRKQYRNWRGNLASGFCDAHRPLPQGVSM